MSEKNRPKNWRDALRFAHPVTHRANWGFWCDLCEGVLADGVVEADLVAAITAAPHNATRFEMQRVVVELTRKPLDGTFGLGRYWDKGRK